MNCCKTTPMTLLALSARSSRPSRKREGEDFFSTRLLRQKKSFSHRNARKSFEIGRSSSSRFDASRCGANEKSSVAAVPQQTHNTPQQNATRTGRQWGQRCCQRRRQRCGQHCGQRCGQLPGQLPPSALLRKRLPRPACYAQRLPPSELIPRMLGFLSCFLASSAAVPCFLARSAASVARQHGDQRENQ